MFLEYFKIMRISFYLEFPSFILNTYPSLNSGFLRAISNLFCNKVN